LSAKFIVSGSEDETIKIWNVPAEAKQDVEQVVKLHAAHTEKAHASEVNFVAVAPNDQFMASASRDKTAKVSTYFMCYLFA
jgi:U3 small nucleolar RNA-associated protein 13